MTSFATFIGTYMRFRISVLTEFKDVFELDHTAFRTAMATLNNSQKRYILDRGNTLSSSMTLLFRDPMNETGTSSVIERNSTTADVNLDSVVLELLGIAIPSNVMNELSDCQLGAEFSLVRRVLFGKKGSSAGLDLNAVTVANTSVGQNYHTDEIADSGFKAALLGIRDAVVPEVERRRLKPISSEKNCDGDDIKEPHVVREMNSLIYQQRLKCVLDRLNSLNFKAEARSRVLKTLLVSPLYFS